MLVSLYVITFNLSFGESDGLSGITCKPGGTSKFDGNPVGDSNSSPLLPENWLKIFTLMISGF